MASATPLEQTAEIVAHALDDERDASEARGRVRRDGLPKVSGEDAQGVDLEPGEEVVAVRESVAVTRLCPGEPDETSSGRLFVTTRRLLVEITPPLDIGLDDIEELAIGGDRLLLTLTDGSGLSIDASSPRVLRVEMAASLAAART